MIKARTDAVWIRKSGDQQDDMAQISNVETMLEKREVSFPPNLIGLSSPRAVGRFTPRPSSIG